MKNINTRSTRLLVDLVHIVFLTDNCFMIMKKIALLLSILLSFALEKGLGFVTINCSTRDGVSCTPRSTVMQIGSTNVDNHQESTVNSPTTTKLKGVYRKISPASLAGFVTGIISCVAHSVASDDYEIAELPPP